MKSLSKEPFLVFSSLIEQSVRKYTLDLSKWGSGTIFQTLQNNITAQLQPDANGFIAQSVESRLIHLERDSSLISLECLLRLERPLGTLE